MGLGCGVFRMILSSKSWKNYAWKKGEWPWPNRSMNIHWLTIHSGCVKVHIEFQGCRNLHAMVEDCRFPTLMLIYSQQQGLGFQSASFRLPKDQRPELRSLAMENPSSSCRWFPCCYAMSAKRLSHFATSFLYCLAVIACATKQNEHIDNHWNMFLQPQPDAITLSHF